MSKLHLVFACATALAGCNAGNMSSTSDGGGDAGMYARRADVTVGAQPLSMVIADVNNDQRADVVVARSGALLLISSDAAGMLKGSRLSSVAGDTSNGLGMGDFDGDGKLDAALANFNDGNAQLLFGADFAASVKTGEGAHPISLAIGDVNSDGKIDVLTANQVNNAVGVMLNMGNRMFATRVDYAAGAAPRALLLGATDGSRPSRLDIVVVLPSLNKVRILLGQGGGAYDPTKFTDLTVGQSPSAVAMADLNGDQSPDLVVTNRLDNTISVLLGQAGGTFASAVPYTVGSEPQQVALGDIDGDGKLDAVVTNGASNDVSILRGQGDGTLRLSETVAVGTKPQPVVITDIDNDGQKDILVGNSGADTVTILYGKKL